MDQVIFPADGDDACGADAISQAGDGVVRYIVCMPGEYAGLVQRGIDGDYDAQLIVQAWSRFRKSLTTQPRGSQVHCPLCPRSLKPRSCAFGLAVPYGIQEPESGMMFALCERCAPDEVATEVAATQAMENVYPGMRPLQAPLKAGRA